ncbi:putative protein kinase RLK-Pelle-CrRLK1L-1 family [Helianthus anomalus]
MESFFKEFGDLRIPLKDIKYATYDFDKSNVIGHGGFGKVYRGQLPHSKGQSMVACKRLDSTFGQGNPEFWKEIIMLTRYTHENLISLIGFCDEDGEKILVYERAVNKSLDRHLHSKTFTWIQRLKVCLGAARGLSYLHDHNGTQQRVLHRDIKSANILLDDKWNAKVSDMGLSKIGPANQPHTAIVTTIAGTPGYLDPMYLKFCILTKESDVYSFGVVLFEVLIGKLCYEKINDSSFQSLVPTWKKMYEEKELKENIFQDLLQEMNPRCLETYSDIAFQCLQEYRERRPTMSVVVEKLETALELQETYEEITETALHPLTYEKIIDIAVNPLTYKSEEELKSCLSKGILINGGKTWFSLNKNGEHCEMISAAECLIPIEGTISKVEYVSEKISRFAAGKCYVTHNGKFVARLQAQFLSPQIAYTVNLVFKRPGEVVAIKPCYVGIRYRLKGETECSVSCLADVKEDGWLMAELYQFESQSRYVDLEILFEGVIDNSYSGNYLLEGIEFQPVEKVEHEELEGDKADVQTISESDDTYWEKKLPNDCHDMIKWSKDDVKWTTKKELYSFLCKGFLTSNGQWFFLAKSGKRCLMVSARDALAHRQWEWKNQSESRFFFIDIQSESRFGEVAFYPSQPFSIDCNILGLSPETTYASYLVYKLPEQTSDYKFPLKVMDANFHNREVLSKLQYIFLLNPQTPVIRQKVDQNSPKPTNRPKQKGIRQKVDQTSHNSLNRAKLKGISQKVDQTSHNPLNRPKLKGIPRQRDDGWMEVQVCEFQSGTGIEPKWMCVKLGALFYAWLRGLTVQGVEFRPE